MLKTKQNMSEGLKSLFTISIMKINFVFDELKFENMKRHMLGLCNRSNRRKETENEAELEPWKGEASSM